MKYKFYEKHKEGYRQYRGELYETIHEAVDHYKYCEMLMRDDIPFDCEEWITIPKHHILVGFTDKQETPEELPNLKGKRTYKSIYY